MKTPQLLRELQNRHEAFSSSILRLDEEAFYSAPAGKWHAGQQLNHICRSLAPVQLAFSLPKWLLGIAFGKINQDSRTYEALVAAYQARLSEGKKAPKAYRPRSVAFADRHKQTTQLRKQIDRLTNLAGRFTEQELYALRLPHPLLGKITLREMLYFTAYHVVHHQEQINNNKNKQTGR